MALQLIHSVIYCRALFTYVCQMSILSMYQVFVQYILLSHDQTRHRLADIVGTGLKTGFYSTNQSKGADKWLSKQKQLIRISSATVFLFCSVDFYASVSIILG